MTTPDHNHNCYNYALNRSQKRCFTRDVLFRFILFVYSYLCYIKLSNCPFLWNSSDEKGKFLFYVFIMTNKFFRICTMTITQT